MGLLWPPQPGVLARKELVLARFGCDTVRLQQGIAEHAGHTHSSADCAVASAAYVVVVLDSVVGAARCIAGTQQTGAHVESHRGWLVLCRYRRDRAPARCFATVAVALLVLDGGQAQVGGSEAAVRSEHAAACRVLLMVRMRA